MVTSNNAQVGSETDARIERYRRAERAFWDRYDLAPAERFVEVEAPPARLRVQELGSGEPVLFVAPGPAGRRAADLRDRGTAVHPAAAFTTGPDHHPHT
jgi:hypothetical protein